MNGSAGVAPSAPASWSASVFATVSAGSLETVAWLPARAFVTVSKVVHPRASVSDEGTGTLRG